MAQASFAESMCKHSTSDQKLLGACYTKLIACLREVADLIQALLGSTTKDLIEDQGFALRVSV